MKMIAIIVSLRFFVFLHLRVTCPDGLDYETQLFDFLSLIYGDINITINQTVFNNFSFSMPIIPSLYENVPAQFTNLDNSVNACEIGTNMSSIIKYEKIVNNSVYYDYTIDTGINNEYPINCMNPSECGQNILNTNNFVDESCSTYLLYSRRLLQRIDELEKYSYKYAEQNKCTGYCWN